MYRGANTQNMLENSPVVSSQSSGMAQRNKQSADGQVCTLRSAFETRTNSKTPASSCLFAWMAIHAYNILNLHKVENDDKVLFQRLRGGKMHGEMLDLGARVLYQPLTHKALGSAQSLWCEGVCVVIRMHIGETLDARTEACVQKEVDKDAD